MNDRKEATITNSIYYTRSAGHQAAARPAGQGVCVLPPSVPNPLF